MDRWYGLYLKLELWLSNPSTCFSYKHEGAFRRIVEEHAKGIPGYNQVEIMLAVDKIMEGRPVTYDTRKN